MTRVCLPLLLGALAALVLAACSDEADPGSAEAAPPAVRYESLRYPDAISEPSP